MPLYRRMLTAPSASMNGQGNRRSIKGMSGARRTALIFTCACLVFSAAFVIFKVIDLANAETKAADCVLVLGGSPTRDIFAAKLAKERPARKILISGSADPCTWLVFDKAGAPKENVFVEHCSQNTFENFIYSTPILKRWGVRKVLLVTDEPQVKRALPMAKLMLGSKGIAVQLERSPNGGGEGPRYPIFLEEMAAMCWAVVGQIVEPECNDVSRLSEVDMKSWYKKGFTCQQQADVSDYKPHLR